MILVQVHVIVDHQVEAMIEKIFATNFANMNGTVSPDAKSNKDYIVVIPYLESSFSIIHNHNRKNIEITLIDGKTIKTASKFIFTLREVKSIKCQKNATHSSSAYSFASEYTPKEENELLIDAKFPTYSSSDMYNYRQYFDDHSDFFIPLLEVQNYLFKLPLPENYFKFLEDSNTKENAFSIEDIRLPTSYNNTVIEGDYVYTNNIHCVKRSLDKLDEYIKRQQPCKIAVRKNNCLKLLENLKTIINASENEFTLREINNSLTKTIDLYFKDGHV